MRELDAYGPRQEQAVLLVSSTDLPVLDHVFVPPGGDVQQRPHSSPLPYRAGDERFIVDVLPDPASPRPAGDYQLDRLRRAAATGRLTFDLAIAPPSGHFRRVGSLHVGARRPRELDALRFTPQLRRREESG